LQIPVVINQLIYAIYQGAIEDKPWQSLLSQLNNLFKADIAALLIVSRQQQDDHYQLSRVVHAQAGNTTLEAIKLWALPDPFQHIAADTPVVVNHTMQDAPPLDPAIGSVIAMNICAKDNSELLLKLRIMRAAEQPLFTAEDAATAATLVDHFKLALQLLDQMAIKKIERNAFADAINQFMLGTLILDRHGKIVASNRVARDTIEHHPSLLIKEGALIIADRYTNEQLYKALENIERGHGSDKPLPRTITVNPSNSLTLGLMVRPVRAEDAHTHPVHAHAVVFISDSQGIGKISAATLKDLFGFTGSESRVAAYLANGHSLTEAAQALSISVNTAKSHARNIYEKTGVNKQTKFIQLVSNSVARVS